MRFTILPFAMAIAACGAPERPAPMPARAIVASEAPAPNPSLPPQTYVLADPDALPPAHVVAIADGTLGVVIDGARTLLSPAGVSVARELTNPPLTGVLRIPAWLGGGFLFQTTSSLYTSDTFDGPLKSLVGFPASIQPPAFGPKGLFVRGASGERWAIDLPSGARAAPTPVGLVEIVAVADGRVAVITEAGGALASIDRGVHFRDVGAELHQPAASIIAVEGEPFFVLGNGHAMRLETSGKLTELPKIPASPKTPERARDPRWHGGEPPLRAVLHRGIPLDDRTALVASGGDVARIELRTGAIVSLAAGRLPPDLPCEAIRAGDVPLVFCGAPAHVSLVASFANPDAPPKIERTFTSDGMAYASDDGALAVSGPCSGEQAAPATACVRDLRGEWSEVTLDDDSGPPTNDAGAPRPVVEVARWIPRGDGGAIGVVLTPALATIDAQTGKARPVRIEALPYATVELLRRSLGNRSRDREKLVDRTWSLTSRGTLRGWLDNGQSVEIDSVGNVKLSPYTFTRFATSGPFALGRSAEGRGFETIDGGATWSEVSPPPTSTSSSGFEPRRCSAVGCDLGVWARIGWDASAPDTLAPPFVAEPAPLIDAPPLALVTCTAAGELKAAQTAPTPDGPEDLGLGASRIPVSKDLENGRSIAYERHLFSRTPVNPAHGSSNEDDAAPRAMLHGYLVQVEYVSDSKGNSTRALDVMGPRRDASSFERKLTFAAPFDPTGAIHTVSFGASALSSAGKGVSLARMLATQDVFEATGPVPVTPIDPGAPSGLVFEIGDEAMDLIGVVTVGSSPALKIGWLHPKRRSIVSAAEIAKDEIAVLAETDGGGDVVYKLGKGGVTDVAELPPPPSSDAYPANPDAIAVGPQGALAILRTPSGAEPPSDLDPAMIIPLGGRPTALASWSTLTSADDAACRADASGYRATIQIVAPWVRIRGTGIPESEPTSMLARVRWSPARVCIEALKTRESVQDQQSGDVVETWMIARFAGPTPLSGRLAIARGTERHQAMSCVIAAKPRP